MNTQQAHAVQTEEKTAVVRMTKLNKVYRVKEPKFEKFGITRASEADVVPVRLQGGQVVYHLINWRTDDIYGAVTSVQDFNDCFERNELPNVDVNDTVIVF